jgi:hypothetical protein
MRTMRSFESFGLHANHVKKTRATTHLNVKMRLVKVNAFSSHLLIEDLYTHNFKHPLLEYY